MVPFLTQTAIGIREKLSVFGNDYDTPDGSCIRDYINVVDLAKAHVVAMNRIMEHKQEERVEVFNIGTGRGLSVLELINAFEEKESLTELVHETLADEKNTGIQIYIGEEAPVSGMKDCSVVTATYELEEGMKGTIGIIGPKRMDYEKVVGTLQTMMHQLDELYKK